MAEDIGLDPMRWRFESSHLDHAEVAQLVESQPSKLGVAGSSPVLRSIGESAFEKRWWVQRSP